MNTKALLAPHSGYQEIKGPFADPGSDADKSFYASPVNGEELGKTSLVVGVKTNF